MLFRMEVCGIRSTYQPNPPLWKVFYSELSCPSDGGDGNISLFGKKAGWFADSSPISPPTTPCNGLAGAGKKMRLPGGWNEMLQECSELLREWSLQRVLRDLHRCVRPRKGAVRSKKSFVVVPKAAGMNANAG
jgi:hypothetical protein